MAKNSLQRPLKVRRFLNAEMGSSNMGAALLIAHYAGHRINHTGGSCRGRMQLALIDEGAHIDPVMDDARRRWTRHRNLRDISGANDCIDYNHHAVAFDAVRTWILRMHGRCV